MHVSKAGPLGAALEPAIFPLVFEKCKVQFLELSEAPSMKVVPKGDCLEEQRDMK